MKQRSEVVGKPFLSSLKICLEEACAGIFKQSMRARNRVGIRLQATGADGSDALESILGRLKNLKKQVQLYKGVGMGGLTPAPPPPHHHPIFPTDSWIYHLNTMKCFSLPSFNMVSMKISLSDMFCIALLKTCA